MDEVAPPRRTFLLPFPKEGRVYDYKFVPDVSEAELLTLGCGAVARFGDVMYIPSCRVAAKCVKAMSIPRNDR